MREAELLAGEHVIEEGAVILHRQVHPTWIDDGEPSSQAFEPTEKDEKCLSVTRGDQQDAGTAFEYHTQSLGLESEGVWGVNVEELKAQGTRAVDDSGLPAITIPSHAYVDFRAMASGKARKRIARTLAAAARERGRLHPSHRL